MVSILNASGFMNFDCFFVREFIKINLELELKFKITWKNNAFILFDNYQEQI